LEKRPHCGKQDDQHKTNGPTSALLEILAGVDTSFVGKDISLDVYFVNCSTLPASRLGRLTVSGISITM